ncbi:phosphopantetheine-binding protein [Micromonospora sp. CA-263727]|uniref:phosphopantetheine-binding protein n=1 Tax=Micromonospora sp. CA-263727 TaxID=3239967 RepID=UPI003D917D6E
MTVTPFDTDQLASLLIHEIEEETGNTVGSLGVKLVDLDMDSLTFSEVLMNLERKLGVELDLVETFELDREADVAKLLTAIMDRL